MTLKSVGPPPNPLTAWDNRTPNTGRATGCANTNDGPGRSNKESDVDPIVSSASDEAHPPSAGLEAIRLARTDACPDCCINVEAPYRVVIEAVGFRAYYACLDCGYFWNTGWRD